MAKRKRIPKIRVCEWCGNFIGRERGPAAKTCSPECQRDRNNAKEKERYQKVKHTQAWKETRASYIERLKHRLSSDPEFAERYYTAKREAFNKFRRQLEQDPVRLAAYREKQRAWHHNLTPEQLEDKKARNRAWYASLDPEFKRMFLLQLREQRALKQLKDAKK